MPSCASASSAAPTRLAVLAAARLTDPGGWDDPASADPAAADRHREKAEKEARVEVWSEPSGTAALASRDLRPANVIAADKRIDALARQLKAAGIEGSLDQLRARAYVALLLGRPMPGLLPPGSGPYAARTDAAGTDTVGAPTGLVAGAVNLTMPLSSFLGDSGEPGEVAGFGPVAAADGRALADRLVGERGSRWCLTLTGRDGRAVAHGCARAAARDGGEAAGRGWELTVTIRPVAVWRLPARARIRWLPALPHAAARDQSPAADLFVPRAGRRPAARCDQDHTVPYDQGGRTCECNLAPLCRRHHRAKQVHGWRLEQPQPGVMTWHLPHGRNYQTTGEPYPV